MREKVEVFKAISEINRIRILMMLLEKPLCVCEITSILELTTATVSNHLAYLRHNNFIKDDKDGKWINYKIITNSGNPIVNQILSLLPEWFSQEKIIQDDLIKVRNVDRHNICSNENRKV